MMVTSSKGLYVKIKLILQLACLLLFLLPISSSAQVLLEKKLSVSYPSMEVAEILDTLSKQFGIRFSYASAVVNSPRKISLHYSHASLRSILNAVFPPRAFYIGELGDQVILKKIKPESQVLIRTSRDSLQRVTVSTSHQTLHSLLPKEASKLAPPSSSNFILTPLKNKNVDSSAYKKPSSLPRYQHVKKNSTLSLFSHQTGAITHTKVSLINSHRKVQGHQIGLINVAQQVSGVQIGLFNFCKKGYRSRELWTSSTLKINAAIKTGTSKLYTVFAAGVSTDRELEEMDWGIAYGLGSQWILSPKTMINIDALLYQLGSDLKFSNYSWHLMQQWRINWGYRLSKKTTVFIGPEFNFYILPPPTDKDHDMDDPSSFYAARKPLLANRNAFRWGINAGIRF